MMNEVREDLRRTLTEGFVRSRRCWLCDKQLDFKESMVCKQCAEPFEGLLSEEYLNNLKEEFLKQMRD